MGKGNERRNAVRVAAQIFNFLRAIDKAPES
jgi:hypothetical protein